MKNNHQEKNNQKALIIGAVLIIVIAAVSLIRNQIGKDSQISNESENVISDSKNYISVEQLQQKISLDKNLKIIDIRDAASFESEHILDSANVDFSQVLAYISGTGETKNYTLVDENGAIGAKIVADVLKKNKELRVTYLKGGFLEWKNQFGPTVVDANPESFADQAKVKYLTSDDLKGLIDSNSNIYILDVRDRSSYVGGHIKNAVNIPLAELEQSRNNIQRKREIIVYDNDGLLAFKAAVKLFDMGIFEAKVLFDGFDSWKQKGFEAVQ